MAAGKFKSRLIVGTGKYRDFAETRPRSRPAAGIVTVAVRRVNITDPNKENLLDYIDPSATRSSRTRPIYSVDEQCAPVAWLEKPAWDMVKLEVIATNRLSFRRAGELERRESSSGGLQSAAYITDDPSPACVWPRQMRRRDATRSADRSGMGIAIHTICASSLNRPRCR